MVQEGFLCGIIIASYENEPFAVMIPSFQLALDIQTVFPHLREIELPDVGDDNSNADLGVPLVHRDRGGRRLLSEWTSSSG